MDGVADRDIFDRWQKRRLVRRDDERGRSLAEEDDDEYRHRMDDPPDDVVAAWMRLDECREKTAELSPLYKDDHTQHECAAGALCMAPPGTDVSASAHRCTGFSLLILFRSLLRGHLVINHVAVLLEGVEVVDMRHVVEEAVADERMAQ